MKTKIIEKNLMKRIFKLTNKLDSLKSNQTIIKKIINFFINYFCCYEFSILPTFENFMLTNGLNELLED